MTLALWSHFFLYSFLATLPVYSETQIDNGGVNGDRNSVLESKESRGELEPLLVHFDNSRPNSRYPSNQLDYPRPYYGSSPYFSYHVEEIVSEPRPYFRPAPVVINNHRPQSYAPGTPVVSNHSPHSTRRPLPTNQADLVRNVTFGLTYPQLHIVPSNTQQTNQNVVSSNSIDFLHKPSEDTTVVYSDVIVIKKPFGDEEGPASLTIYTSRNDSNQHVKVSTDFPTSTTQETEAPTTPTTEEPTTTEKEDVVTEIATKSPDLITNEEFEDDDSDSQLVSNEVVASQPSSVGTAGSTHLTSFRPPSLAPPHSLLARPLSQRLLIAIPSVLVALGLLALMILL